MIGPIARIVLRYIAAALVTYGVMAPEMGDALATDPDMIALVGGAIGALVEGAYAFAKRQGWAT